MVARELLRPLPFRGDLIAAGAVVLAVGALLVDTRMQDAWAAGVRCAVVAAAAAVLLALAWRAPVEGPAPRTYVSVLLVAAFPLAAAALAELADALGGSAGSAGTIFWVLGALAAGYAVLAQGRGSAVCTMLAAASAVGAALAFWGWVFEPRGETAYRWLLLGAIVLLGLGAVRLRDGHRRHAVALIDVAGLAGIAIAAVSMLGLVVEGAGTGGIGTGWEIVLLIVGLGLVAYAAVDREPGPGWIGALVLVSFVSSAATDGSLLWWPLLLVVLGGAVVAAGLRPTTPAPPAPDADAPPAPTRALR
ncbi:hypothetical protein [Capillimicrobium parvum]|uniref:Uncharacterized protein n=1 Tax=Capillimicrobium parvum TaxID=2884022 RepID=A0A9E6XW13_9ACTN|nr:hypothetical protein [Capillimicrobium parvum]UGS35478.1 hypothetical protein DSM104329_01866 [Capillimicrobium parvum]